MNSLILPNRNLSGLLKYLDQDIKNILVKKKGTFDKKSVESVRRAMRAEYNREVDILESHLPFLASVGSVSPYIGLFGTVWGIMNAFIGLANVAQASLWLKLHQGLQKH